MPELEGIGGMIGALGFPIVCTLLLGWFAWKFVSNAFTEIMKQNKERETKLYETIAEIRAQLKEASVTNAGFVQVLENMSKDIEDIKDKIKE